jgi:arginyl-tRNA synthetase
MHLPVSISSEISGRFAGHIEENPTDYVCVYGSSVYSPDKLTSDVDLFTVTHGVGTLAVGPLVEFVRDLHIRHGRDLDAEVPYDNKVHYTAAEVEAAVQFAGFEVNGPNITVPPVRKEAAFLQSPAIKARLALNGLTTPHAVFGKDFSRYHTARERAGEAATLLAISLLGQEEFTIPALHEALTVAETGVSGEMFLGYKTEYPIVSEYLRGELSGGVDRLTKQRVVQSTMEGHMVQWDSFDPLGYMQATAPPQM